MGTKGWDGTGRITHPDEPLGIGLGTMMSMGSSYFRCRAAMTSGPRKADLSIYLSIHGLLWHPMASLRVASLVQQPDGLIGLTNGLMD